MILIQEALIDVADVANFTLECGDRPVKLTIALKDGKKRIFTAEEEISKRTLLLDTRILHQKLGLKVKRLG